MIENEVFVDDFKAESDIETIAAAIGYAIEHKCKRLNFSPKVYEITTSLARETQKKVMMGEYSDNPQRIMFNPNFVYSRGIDFNGAENLEIKGNGATFMVDGFMEVVSLRNCKNILLSGITIDHLRKPYTRGIVKNLTALNEKNEREADIEWDAPIFKETPLELRHIYYDTENKKYYKSGFHPIEFTDPTHTKVRITRATDIKKGFELYVMHTYHSRPAILIENAENITLDSVTIHSQPGMGIVGNRSENILLRCVNVIPSPGHNFSTNTDATHFTSITGKLRFESCVFRAQGDDFTNVHTYYQTIIKRLSDTECIIQEKTPDGTHAQSLDYPDVGDTLELTSLRTLLVSDRYKVVSCENNIPDWCCKIVLDHPLPENTDGLVFADITRLPRLEAVNCRAESHFSRGILVKCRDALIEGNTFIDIQGPAIMLAGEAGWSEGVCPSNVCIKNNTIKDCGWEWGLASGIEVKADSKEPVGQSIFNIKIENNFIDSPDHDHGIYCRNVDRLSISGNTIKSKKDGIVIERCENTVLGENKIYN